MGLIPYLLAGLAVLPAAGLCAGPGNGHGVSGIEPPAAHARGDSPSIQHPGQPGQKSRAPMGGAGSDAMQPPSGYSHDGEGLRGNLESGLIVSGDGKIVSTRPGEQDDAAAPADTHPAAHAARAKRAGLAVRTLSQAERHYLGVSDGGLVVTSVDGDAARHAGLKEGDVVLTLDGVSVSDPDQFQQLLHQLPRDRPVPVLVRRPGSTLFLPLVPAAP